MSLALDSESVVSFGCNAHGQCGTRRDMPEGAGGDGEQLAAGWEGGAAAAGGGGGGGVYWKWPAAAPCLVEKEGLPARGARVSRVAAGANFTLLVTDAGLLSCGANGFGQLGRDTGSRACDGALGLVSLPHKRDLAPSLAASLEARRGGRGAVWKAGEGGCGREGGAKGVVQDVQCGDEHSIAVLSGGSVWVWGRGTQGALGLGSQTKNVVHPVMLPSAGDVKGAGMGQVFLPPSLLPSLLPSLPPSFPPSLPSSLPR